MTGAGALKGIDSLQQWQTLIVGIVGFAGVMLTIAMNAWLSRRQHVREIHHEARVLRAALKAELEVIREAFNDRIEIINNAGTSRSMLVPLETMTDVYASLIDRIGFLSERETGTCQLN